MATEGKFGLIWRKHYKSNNFSYRFEEKGSGIGGSDADQEIKWFMNKDFRLALLRDIIDNSSQKVIDFKRYDLKAIEPKEMTRRWSLMGEINQKQTRSQDKPVAIDSLPQKDRVIISKRYPYLFNQ